jgi:hypothetical protein
LIWCSGIQPFFHWTLSLNSCLTSWYHILDTSIYIMFANQCCGMIFWDPFPEPETRSYFSVWLGPDLYRDSDPDPVSDPTWVFLIFLT